MNIYSRRQRWKRLLFIAAALIGITSLLYTDGLIKKLAEEERKKVELWAKGTKMLANIGDENVDISFVFEVIRDNETVPVILADEKDNVISHRNLDSLRSQDKEFVLKELEEMRRENEPIEVGLANGNKNYIYYKNSTLFYQLKYYPYVQLGVISLFVLVSYFAFSTSRRAEQDQVWVGMAKETAHQLGTPLSSLIAWMDFLEMKGVDKATLDDIRKDIKRLEVITERFSKIGAKPDLQPQPILEVLNESVSYIQTRSSKKVEFEIKTEGNPETQVKLNVALFAWVIENLCRNAVDAMEGAGKITVNLQEAANQIIIDVSDTGKGIPKSKQKTIFEPGFTTKKRGWGLGLSLTRRIIENYHGGKIFVKHSEPGKGTTFRIILDRSA